MLAYLALSSALALQLIVPMLLKRAIDRGIVDGDRSYLLRAAVILVLVTIAFSICLFFRVYLFTVFAEHIAYDLRQALYSHLQTLSFSFYDTHQTGQLMARATEDINNVRALIFTGLRTVFMLIVMLVAVSIILVRIDTLLAIVSLATMPVLLYASIRYEAGVRPLFFRIQQQFGVMTSLLQENIAGARVVRAYAQEPREIARFESQLGGLRDHNIKASRKWASAYAILLGSSGASAVIVLWLGGRQVLSGAMTVGSLVAFNGYLALFADPVRWLGLVVNRVAQAAASTERLFDVLDAKPAIADLPGAQPLIVAAGDVQFEHVSLTYPGQRHPALVDICLSARPGQTIAVVGTTGAGKSSLVNLLPRFRDPSAGRILIDGQDIRHVTLTSLRPTIGSVMQEPFLFSMTIRENIAFGRPDASDADVIAAARAANIHDFIDSLPAKYATMVGERGVSLSGGQKQRVAIARTLILNPRILILDDATSSVDSETEAEIQNALANLMSDRTTFIIAQRLDSIAAADQVLVVDQGRIVDRGTHDELIARDGVYRRIYVIQAQTRRTTPVSDRV